VPGVLPVRLWLAALVWLVLGAAAWAQDRVQLQATNEDGFGRLVLEFSDRMDLPPSPKPTTVISTYHRHPRA
jgi:hypothetical protein